MRQTTTGVYLNQEARRIRATVALLKHIKAFLASSATRMKDPYSGFGVYLDREQAAHKLRWLIHVAINRKAGHPDVPGRKYTSDYQACLLRDAGRVRGKLKHRVVIHQFETREVERRLGHLLQGGA